MIQRTIFLLIICLGVQVSSHSLFAQEIVQPLGNNKPHENLRLDSNQPVLNIKLNSDKSTINGKTGVFEHCGNAVLIQGGLKLTANCLVGKKRDDGSYAYIIATGDQASLVRVIDEKQQELQVNANSIEYKVPDHEFVIFGNAVLKLTQKPTLEKKSASLKISAQDIMFDDKDQNSQKIRAHGSPVRITLTKSGSVELEAESKLLYYDSGTFDLKLSKSVTANLALGQITAGIFEYNSESQISSFEKSNNEQIEIIQSKKQTK